MPWLWYGSLFAIVLLGTIGVVFSREERIDAVAANGGEHPRPGSPPKGDHWHAAYGVWVCNKYDAPIQSDQDPVGVHTHNDGIIHIHPFTRQASGKNAVLGKFADTVGLKISKDSFKEPGQKRHETGDKCDGKTAEVQYRVDGRVVKGDPRKIRLRDNQVIIIALAPKGAKIPSPPSKEGLNHLEDVGTTATSSPSASVVPSTPPPPPSSSSTTPPASSTTAAP